MKTYILEEAQCSRLMELLDRASGVARNGSSIREALRRFPKQLNQEADTRRDGLFDGFMMCYKWIRDNSHLSPSAGNGLSVDEVIVLKDAASWWSSTSRTKQAARKRKEHAELVRAIAARLESAAKAKS